MPALDGDSADVALGPSSGNPRQPETPKAPPTWELAACYLGGSPLRRFVHAGLATEHTPGAVRRLDAALETEWLPFTAENY